MIFITGDCHGNFERFNPSIFPEQKEMTKEDYVIICGDFGGVLEPDDPDFEKKYVILSRGDLPFRINHWSWWKQELPSKEEMEEGRQNLEKHDNKVDFIVTHSCASSTQDSFGYGLYSIDIWRRYARSVNSKNGFSVITMIIEM